MDQRDSRCPCARPSEPTARGTGLAQSAGKEDPVELDSSLRLRGRARGVEQMGAAAQAAAAVKHHYLRAARAHRRDTRRWGVWLGRHIC